MAESCYVKARKKRTKFLFLQKSDDDNNKHSHYYVKDGCGVQLKRRKGVAGKGQREVTFTTQSLSRVPARESPGNPHECSRYKFLSQVRNHL